MRALSIRQPYAEMILRGEKTIEYRSRPTKLIGERFYIYAGKAIETQRRREGETKWIENNAGLPRGVIVGTATISRCVRDNGHYEWHLSNVKRLDKPRKPKGRPQPVWFMPF